MWQKKRTLKTKLNNLVYRFGFRSASKVILLSHFFVHMTSIFRILRVQFSRNVILWLRKCVFGNCKCNEIELTEKKSEIERTLSHSKCLWRKEAEFLSLLKECLKMTPTQNRKWNILFAQNVTNRTQKWSSLPLWNGTPTVEIVGLKCLHRKIRKYENEDHFWETQLFRSTRIFTWSPVWRVWCNENVVWECSLSFGSEINSKKQKLKLNKLTSKLRTGLFPFALGSELSALGEWLKEQTEIFQW